MPTLYLDVLKIAQRYLGIAAKDYIDRRCRIAASDTTPEQFPVERLHRLVAGIDMTAHKYMSDERANAFKREVEGLGAKHRRTNTAR